MLLSDSDACPGMLSRAAEWMQRKHERLRAPSKQDGIEVAQSPDADLEQSEHDRIVGMTGALALLTLNVEEMEEFYNVGERLHLSGIPVTVPNIKTVRRQMREEAKAHEAKAEEGLDNLGGGIVQLVEGQEKVGAKPAAKLSADSTMEPTMELDDLADDYMDPREEQAAFEELQRDRQKLRSDHVATNMRLLSNQDRILTLANEDRQLPKDKEVFAKFDLRLARLEASEEQACVERQELREQKALVNLQPRLANHIDNDQPPPADEATDVSALNAELDLDSLLGFTNAEDAVQEFEKVLEQMKGVSAEHQEEMLIKLAFAADMASTRNRSKLSG